MTKITIYNGQRVVNQKASKPQLMFGLGLGLCSARCLMVVNISVKFRENTSNGFYVTGRTRQKSFFTMFKRQ